MNDSEKFRKIRVSILGSVTAGLVAALAVSAAGASPNSIEPPADGDVVEASLEEVGFRITEGTNERGQTYGPAPDLSIGEAPDLIEAWATNGRLGYIRANDVIPLISFADSVDQALAQDRSSSPESIPVFESDGVTVIGEFVIGASGAENAAREDS